MEESYESPYLHCLNGLWIYSLAPASIIAIIFEIIIGYITNSLYYRPIFKDSSDVLKKTNPVPDIVLMFVKIILNLLFILDKGEEKEHWAILSFVILVTGINAYYTLSYQHRQNKILMMACNIFASLSFLGFITLFIGKILKFLLPFISYFFLGNFLHFLFLFFTAEKKNHMIALISNV
jgi:hypothetical protein